MISVFKRVYFFYKFVKIELFLRLKNFLYSADCFHRLFIKAQINPKFRVHRYNLSSFKNIFKFTSISSFSKPR